MKTNCNLCQSSLIFDVYDDGVEVSFCPKCDINCKKKSLGGLLGEIKDKWPNIKYNHGYPEDENEITIQYYCIKCGCPTNQYGYCLWCEDELRETL